jgi:hypothetical protein
MVLIDLILHPNPHFRLFTWGSQSWVDRHIGHWNLAAEPTDRLLIAMLISSATGNRQNERNSAWRISGVCRRPSLCQMNWCFRSMKSTPVYVMLVDVNWRDLHFILNRLALFMPSNLHLFSFVCPELDFKTINLRTSCISRKSVRSYYLSTYCPRWDSLSTIPQNILPWKIRTSKHVFLFFVLASSILSI